MRITQKVWRKWRRNRWNIYAALVVYTLLMSIAGAITSWYIGVMHALLHDDIGWAIMSVLLFPIGILRGSLIMLGVL